MSQMLGMAKDPLEWSNVFYSFVVGQMIGHVIFFTLQRVITPEIWNLACEIMILGAWRTDRSDQTTTTIGLVKIINYQSLPCPDDDRFTTANKKSFSEPPL